MYLTLKRQIKYFFKTNYKSVKKLSHIAKNLTNQIIYNIRQYYFKEGKYLSYKNNCNLLKSSPNYKLLNSNMSQQILKEVNSSFKNFLNRVYTLRNSHLLALCRWCSSLYSLTGS